MPGRYPDWKTREILKIKGEKPGHLKVWSVLKDPTGQCGIVFEIKMGKEELRFRVNFPEVKQEVLQPLMREIVWHEERCDHKKKE